MFGLAITAGEVVLWAIQHRAQIEAVASAAVKYGPAVVQIGKEGFTALQAAHKAAPDLVPHVKDLAKSLMPYLPAGAKFDVDQVAEKIAQDMFGPPGWTNDETQRWFDRSSAANA